MADSSEEEREEGKFKMKKSKKEKNFFHKKKKFYFPLFIFCFSIPLIFFERFFLSFLCLDELFVISIKPFRINLYLGSICLAAFKFS
mmetsp:Transcript_4814/g.11509  ORF Transcript_4814/g.11509 Transcript_4814/m.11509 type:complete len:87 (+) Transcript_4814:360-620(+)